MRQGLTPPRVATPRTKAPTLGPVLDAVARELAVGLVPWQRLVADVSMELRVAKPRPRFVASTVGVLVPRQCGKTMLARCRGWTQCLLPSLGELHHLAVGPQQVGWLAQDRANALRSWSEGVDQLMASPYAGEVRKVRLQRGDESVVFWNRSVLHVITPNFRGPRGHSLDLVVLDEALAHDASLLGALAPTQAQRDQVVGSLGAQLFVASTEGDERSTLLSTLAELGRRAVIDKDRRRCWLEWSADPAADPYDPATWRAAIPTLDRPNGIATEFVRIQSETMDLDDFRREFLCLHTPAVATHVVDPQRWAACPQGTPGREVTFAIDATPDGTAAALVAAGMGHSGIAVEIVRADPGLDWVAAAAIDHARRWDATVVVDSTGPLAFLIPQFINAEVEVLKLNSSEAKSAAARFAQLVDEGRVEHLADARFTTAVGLATRRRSGDRWGFDRYVGDLSALVAASLGTWALDTTQVLQAQVW